MSQCELQDSTRIHNEEVRVFKGHFSDIAEDKMEVHLKGNFFSFEAIKSPW